MRVTLYDLANATGLAVSTVSRALRGSGDISEVTRQRVAQAAADLGYKTKASSPASMPDQLLVVMENEHQFPLSHELVLAGIRDYLETNGNGTLLVGPQIHHTDEGRAALLHLVRGAVFVMPHAPNALMAKCRNIGLPVAVANRSHAHLAPEPADIAVHVDECEVARLIIEHLVEHGHRRVAYAAQDSDNCMMQARAEALKGTLTAFGLPVVPEWFHLDMFTHINEFTQTFRRPEPPTALVCASDYVAMRAIHYLRKAGIETPSDVSVVGIHDTAHAEFMLPPLTTVHIPLYQIGLEAARQVMCRDYAATTGAAPKVDITFQPHLVRRASVTRIHI